MPKKVTRFSDYQKLTAKLSQFKNFGIDLPALVYFTLGLNGETGELTEKVKKAYRDDGGRVNTETKDYLKLELGDALWYLSQISTTIGVGLEEVAEANISKLRSRLERNRIHGSGDKR